MTTDLQNAYKILATQIAPFKNIREIDIYDAFGEINAQDILASMPLPSFDNSAMDGYVLNIKDATSPLKVLGKIMAGDDASSLSISPNTCYKIMTGAMIPPGENLAVAQKENVELKDEHISISSPLKIHQNIRLKGEEIALNSIIVSSGTKLNHINLSLIASQGIKKIKIFSKPKIAIYSTGDELVELGESIAKDKLYNTNALSIKSYLSHYQYNCTYNGILKDTIADIERAISSFRRYDVVVTSGGASVGDADLLKQTLVSNGAKILLDGINTKPGRHICILRLQDTIIFMLPGNPLASSIHTTSLLLPLLEYLSGADRYLPRSILLDNGEDFTLKSGTTNIVAGRIKNGIFYIYNHGKIGSNMIGVLDKNDALCFCNKATFSQGDKIHIVPYFMDFCDTMDFINQ